MFIESQHEIITKRNYIQNSDSSHEAAEKTADWAKYKILRMNHK